MIFPRVCRFYRPFLRHSLNICKNHKKSIFLKAVSLPSLGLTYARCETTPYNFNWEEESLEHEFLIKQSCTVSVNAASQLLTVTLVAIQDTNQRLRESLSQEISLVRQAMEWGDLGTPEEHWERLVAVRSRLADLRHNLHTLKGYMEYVERLATTAAEISFLSGNTLASDALCERLDHASRTNRKETEETHTLQEESLKLQRIAIINSSQIENILKSGDNEDQSPLKREQVRL